LLTRDLKPRALGLAISPDFLSGANEMIE